MIICDEEYQKLEVIKEKERIYLTFKKGMKKPEHIPGYVDYVKKALKDIPKGYTLLVDIHEDREIPTFGLTKVIQDSQKLFLNAGVRKTAMWVAADLLLQKFFIDVTSKLSKMAIKTFKDKAEAELWLDKKE
jgi:hypothetical protein